MAWRKGDLRRAMAREFRGILGGAAKGLLEIFSLGFYPAKGWKKSRRKSSNRRR